MAAPARSDADALFLFEAEPVPAGCKVTASLEGILLARCP